MDNIFSRLVNFYLKKMHPIKYAKRLGVQMGKECRLIGSPDWGSEPYLIKIGNRTEISCNVSFITHDGATWVFRNKEKYKDVVRFGKIEIGDNCFVGARSIILPGVCIGDNSIIAAGALVSKSVPSGEIWGGVPAKFISKTEVYAEKCLRETPSYDKNNFLQNRKEEIERIVNDYYAKK